MGGASQRHLTTTSQGDGGLLCAAQHFVFEVECGIFPNSRRILIMGNHEPSPTRQPRLVTMPSVISAEHQCQLQCLVFFSDEAAYDSQKCDYQRSVPHRRQQAKSQSQCGELTKPQRSSKRPTWLRAAHVNRKRIASHSNIAPRLLQTKLAEHLEIG